MEQLTNIQSELKAPKTKRNNFAKYNYRSAEDILENVKPIAKKYGCTLTLSDTIEMVGDRYYVKATATLSNGSESVSVTAYARESDTKPGNDAAQITGAASSYARKYALNGLFCIDDTKDSDTDEYHNEQLEAALKAIASSDSTDALVCIHAANPTLQQDKTFMTALTKRKQEIIDAAAKQNAGQV